ncbi:MAG: PepSY domain-containing protein [Chloroflexota bacterium]
MNTIRYALASIILLMLPATAVFAQDDAPLDLATAIETVRAIYGQDVTILSIEFDREDDADDEDFGDICFDFELRLTATDDTFTFEDVDVCQDAMTNTITLDTATSDDSASNTSTGTSDTTVQDATITAAQAITTALELFPNNTVTSVELYIEDGILLWDVELDGDARDVYVDAQTGSVLEFDNDLGASNSPSTSNVASNETATITVDEAIATALGLFPNSVVNDIDLDFEDGILVWDIELDDDTRSVDINALTGEVLDFDSDFSSDSTSNTNAVDSQTATISSDEAIAIALTIFPNSTVSDIDLDYEDGILVWDIELDGDARDVYVDAQTGNVLEFDSDSDSDNGSNNSVDNTNAGGNPTATITADEAIAAALTIFPNSVVSDVDLDFEDGRLVWDIELDDDTRTVYIDAQTGSVLEFGFDDDDRWNTGNTSSSGSDDDDDDFNDNTSSGDSRSDDNNNDDDWDDDDDDWDDDDDDDDWDDDDDDWDDDDDDDDD